MQQNVGVPTATHKKKYSSTKQNMIGKYSENQVSASANINGKLINKRNKKILFTAKNKIKRWNVVEASRTVPSASPIH